MAVFGATATRHIRKQAARGNLRDLKEEQVLEVVEEATGISAEGFDPCPDNCMCLSNRTLQDEPAVPGWDSSFNMLWREGPQGRVKASLTSNVYPLSVGESLQPVEALVSSDEGCFFLIEGELQEIRGINPGLISYEEVACIYGQKSDELWSHMNISPIAGMNKASVRTVNTCGPTLATHYFFPLFENGVVTPLPAAFFEPVPNRDKNEVVPAHMSFLNRILPDDQKFYIRTLAGQEAFVNGRLLSTGHKTHPRTPYVIAHPLVYERVMPAFREAVMASPWLASPEAHWRARYMRDQVASGVGSSVA